MSVFTLDNVAYPDILVMELKRSFEILDGENVGRVKTGDMKRDIIGTYYNYSMQLDTSEASLAEYDALYETLSAPVDSHVLTVPYAQGALTFDAYVTSGEDELISMESGRNKWEGLSVRFIAMSPKRVPS
ncbi:MAG: hypothetical protein VB064_04815 [Oscillospiraceae bacterium]|nr:hypothetical protein [Oscillospiraceae bacterium]